MTQWETPAILPNRNLATPPPPTPLPIKKCALCLLPRLLAINPGSTSNVALPSFPQVTALNTIIIAASPLVCLCVCVCLRENKPATTWLHACLSVAAYVCVLGGGGGGLLDQRKPKSSYKRAMHSGWAEERREGDRRKERERAREREGEKS